MTRLPFPLLFPLHWPVLGAHVGSHLGGPVGGPIGGPVGSHLSGPVGGHVRVAGTVGTAAVAATGPVHSVVPAADHAVVRAVADIVQMQPQPNALPGGNVLQNLMNGLEFWALALALVGLVVGAAAWALGSHGQNYHQSYVGRRAVLISGLAALLIGAGPGIVSFFFNTGQSVHSP